MKRPVVFGACAALIASGAFAAPKARQRPFQKNFEINDPWDRRTPWKYEPTLPNNRPTGPRSGWPGTGNSRVLGAGQLSGAGAGNGMKSRVPYDRQAPTNGFHADAPIGGGNRIGSFGSGQSAVGFPNSGGINQNTRLGKKKVETPAPEVPEGLLEALDDIKSSWSARESKRIRTRFPSQQNVAVFQDGAFSYETPGAELAKQVGAGAEQLQTERFELNKPTKESEKRYFVSGKHTFLDDYGAKRTLNVSYVLERLGERWQIAEYGVSQRPITRHGIVPAKEEAFAPGF